MRSVAEAAYLAGFIDGEGSIAITASKLMNGVKNGGLALIMKITNTNKSVLEDIASLWGGRLALSYATTGAKPVFALYWGAKDAGTILGEIKPYLKIKKEQCDIALQFQSTLKGYSRNCGKGNFERLSAEEVQLRHGLRARLQRLNKRGIQI